MLECGQDLIPVTITIKWFLKFFLMIIIDILPRFLCRYLASMSTTSINRLRLLKGLFIENYENKDGDSIYR